MRGRDRASRRAPAPVMRKRDMLSRMTHPMRLYDRFEGCWNRYERALAHKEAAAREWSAFLGEEPYDARLSAIDDNGRFEMWIEQRIPVPPVISIEFGEYLYNLRAALDYLAFAVSVADSKQDPPPGEELIQFPIYDTEKSWMTNEYRIESFSDKHRSWVKAVQPFMGDKSPRHYLLPWLNDLARKDRHRQLHVAGAYIAEAAPMVDAPNGAAVPFEEVEPVAFVEGDTVIARFQVVPFSAGDEVEANPNLALDVEIEEFARGRPDDAKWLWFRMSMRLLVIDSFVEATIGRFERDCIGWTRSKFVAEESNIERPPE